MENSAGPVKAVCLMDVICCYTNVNALIQNILDGLRKNINMAAGYGFFADFSLSSFSVLH